MSWSLSSAGKAVAVAAQIADQISKISLSDAGEMETVKLIGDLLAQTLTTYDPDKLVSVAAAGHMGYANYTDKSGPYQQFGLKVDPMHLSV
jgi:hypothetical protein